VKALLLLRDVVAATFVALIIIGVGMGALLALPPLWGLAFAVTLAALVILWVRRRHGSDEGAPFALRAPVKPDHAQGASLAATVVTGWAAVLVTAVLVGIIAPEVEDAAGIWAAMERYTRTVPGFLALGVYAVVLAPLVEEVAFRGFIQGRIATWASPGAAVFLTALLFAIVHAGRPHWTYLLVPLALGIAAGSAVHRFRSVWVGVAIHALWNATVASMILLQRVMPQASPVDTPSVEAYITAIPPSPQHTEQGHD
jgi:membrane protease YdiL (CAAX protease family)